LKTIIEPFRIKMTEPIKLISREERVRALARAHNNVFLLDAEDCCIDLLTDSGTGAMSTEQWAALMLGDESYAGSKSWKKFIEFVGAQAVDFVCHEGLDTALEAPFKGNMDLQKLELCVQEHGAEKIPFAMITVTNNTGGGQPVSMENIREVKSILARHNIPLVIDACRFAENAYFIHENEPGYDGKSLLEIAREMFSYADAATMSCKKDGLANIGGFFICNDDTWAEDFKNLLILREGFPTYGGLAGRDLEVIAVGLMEALDYHYQVYRHATVTYLGKKLDELGVPYVRPVGGHAVFLDAKAFLPHLPASQYPGIGLVNALYLDGGVRAVELGSVMFGKPDGQGNEQPAPLELVRLAFPRRVYTQSHFDYLVEVIADVWQERDAIKGYRITSQPDFLRHFTCHFEPAS